VADDSNPLTYVVCAASAVDATRWAREQSLTQRQTIYASSAAKIDGWTNFTVVRLPGFYLRPDADQIDAVIRRNEQKRDSHG
jgi:hypothetical protein